jgi:hypothetical protein
VETPSNPNAKIQMSNKCQMTKDLKVSSFLIIESKRKLMLILGPLAIIFCNPYSCADLL